MSTTRSSSCEKECDAIEEWELSDVSLEVSNRISASVGTSNTLKDLKSYDIENSSVDWHMSSTVPITKTSSTTPQTVFKGLGAVEPDSIILILVDLTVLSSGKIHNRFDKFSVNDQDAKKKICDEKALHYDDYANNSKLIMDQTVRHCSGGVWKEALESLRNQYKGHYWFPFFPPPKVPL